MGDWFQDHHRYQNLYMLKSHSQSSTSMASASADLTNTIHHLQLVESVDMEPPDKKGQLY